MSVLLTPASWFQIPWVGVGPKVVAFWVTVKVKPHSVTLDLRGGRRGGWWTGAHYSMGGVHVQRCAEPNETQVTCTHTSATVRTQNRDGWQGSSPSSFIPTLKLFLLWGNDWCCKLRNQTLVNGKGTILSLIRLVQTNEFMGWHLIQAI